MNFIKVGSACPVTKVADVDFNVENINLCIDEAYDKEVKYLVFPELAVTSYTCGDLFLNSALLNASINGIKNMAGNVQAYDRTATEINYSVNGQEARLNMILEAINRKIIVPMVEKTAEIISNFKLGNEVILIKEKGSEQFIEIDDKIRNSNYVYRYGDRKASFERKSKLKELFNVIQSFAKIDVVAKQINWLECFKFVIEQYGVENANNYLTSDIQEEQESVEG